MPRGRKPRKAQSSIEDRIATITAEIKDLQEQLKVKKAEMKQLEEEKIAADKQRILDVVMASGKSIDEVIAIIKASAAGESVETPDGSADAE